MLVTSLRAVAALAFALAPVAARAEGAAFTVPAHYVTVNPGDTGSIPLYRVWSRTGAPKHVLTVTVSPAPAELASTVEGDAIGARESGAIDVVRGDAAPLCGAPSMQLSYAHANKERSTSRYVVVAGKLLVANYDRPVRGVDDPAALAALSTLCSGAYQSAGPPGWKIAAGSPANSGTWRSPDGVETFSESARSATAGADITRKPSVGGTITNDSRESCGTIAYRRFTETRDAVVSEHAEATVGSYAYVFAYVRPSVRAANPAALAVLTGFCG